MNPDIQWYPINRNNVKDVIKLIPDCAVVWYDFGCEDCHRDSIKCEEDPTFCGKVTHNCVKEYGRDYVVSKQLCHSYTKIKEMFGRVNRVRCNGMSCDGKCLYVNAIGIDKNSNKKHDIGMTGWQNWWQTFAEWMYPFQQLCIAGRKLNC